MPGTTTWMLWMALAFLYSMLTYNPVYLGLLFITLSIIGVVKKQPIKTYLKIALLVSIIPLCVNFFLVHSGDTIFFEIPGYIPLLGIQIPMLFLAGPVTLESVAMGLIMALLLADMLVAFQLFNSQASADEMVGIIPSYFSSISMTTLIALRFIPTVTGDFQSIREAQLSKGYRFTKGSLPTRLKNNVSMLIPTLITALERGFNLSESMAARAYSSHRISYRPKCWKTSDKILCVIYASSILVTLYLKVQGTLYYWPYNSLQLPEPDMLALIPIIALLSPLLIEHGARG